MTHGRDGKFVSIVEVFPPSFGADSKKEPSLGLRQKSRDFVERVRRIQNLADYVLVADVKDTARLKLSAVHSAVLLSREIGVDAVPVITARDSNKPAVLSSILTALSLGLKGLMLVWGDRYSSQDGAKNVYDFASLSETIGKARELAVRASLNCRIFAPVDLSRLGTPKGLRMAKNRLEAGADFLLAQPPTTDTIFTLKKHSRILKKSGLLNRVIPNVFPFRDLTDIQSCRSKFGWELPRRLERIAERGERELLKEARNVAQGLMEAGFPGVYVSTRGRPELARFILD